MINFSKDNPEQIIMPVDLGLDDITEPVSKTAIRLKNGKLIDLFNQLNPPSGMTLTPEGFDAKYAFTNATDDELLKMWFQSIDNQYKK